LYLGIIGIVISAIGAVFSGLHFWKLLSTEIKLESGNRIAFVMPTFTMAAYDNYKDDSFYTFYKKYAFINENDFVTIY
jgi:hypothetical protein